MPRRPRLETDESPTGSSTGTAKKKSVLIVEDSEDFRNLLKLVVEDEGFDGVLFPVHQEDILSTVREIKPSVVLMDLALRRKGGMDYINDIKNDPETRDTPVIIITGRDLSQREILELEVKGVKYLRKGRVEMYEIKSAVKAAAYRQ